MRYRRIFTIVVDSFGIGQDPEAERFKDAGANTFLHIYQSQQGLDVPTLYALGLGQLDHVDRTQTMGYACRLQEASNAKDTLTGHWEIMGLLTTQAPITFTEHGFPPELIHELEKQTGRKVIGKKAASGTAILDELGEEEIATGHMIVYTSADSVLQICGNEETFGLDELYRCCEIARQITMKPEWRVGRVIARPYVGMRRGEFVRTANRRDYALQPPQDTVLDALKEDHYDVIGIGKIHDIFSGRGLTQTLHSENSVHGMEQTTSFLDIDFTGLCFTNLVDFDAKWGHRRNPAGYKNELETFDKKLKQFIEGMRNDDLLIVCADHGNDPTYSGTDHTRELVPCLMYSPDMKKSGVLPDGRSFADIGQTIAENFGIADRHWLGRSRLSELI